METDSRYQEALRDSLELLIERAGDLGLADFDAQSLLAPLREAA